MKISKTMAYAGWAECPLSECFRHYCQMHRLLYRDCDTAILGFEGDQDIIGGTHEIWEITGDCPKCAKVSERKRYEIPDQTK